MQTVFRWLLPLPLTLWLASPMSAETGLSTLPSDVTRSAGASTPLCYMETSEGEFLDLTFMCGQSDDDEAQVIRESKPCYFLDENGQACPVATLTGGRR